MVHNAALLREYESPHPYDASKVPPEMLKGTQADTYMNKKRRALEVLKVKYGERSKEEEAVFKKASSRVYSLPCELLSVIICELLSYADLR